MTSAPVGPAIDRAPADIDALVDWFEWVSERLVLLDDFSLADVRRAIGSVDSAIRRHLANSPNPPSTAGSVAARIALDHRMFPTSLDQLAWFLAIVERDDHGGNRQALGQYGRLLAEALRRHREDERHLGSAALARGIAPPSNSN